jgi:hypothetical protein
MHVKGSHRAPVRQRAECSASGGQQTAEMIAHLQSTDFFVGEACGDGARGPDLDEAALAAARSKDTAGIDRTFGCWPERRESPRTPAKRAPGRLGCVRFCRSIRGQVTRRRVRRFLLLPHASLRSGRYGRLSSLRGYVLLQHSTIFLFLFF